MAKIRILTAGESHGPKLTGIIEGIPAGFFIDHETINFDLARRQQGFGRGGRMKIEKDQVFLSAGVIEKKSTGAPIAVEIKNLDHKNWVEKDIAPMASPRPGHADYAGAIKYNHDDLRLTLERASARETAMRTALGSICKIILREFGIEVLSFVTQIGSIKSKLPEIISADQWQKIYASSLQNEFAFCDDSKLEEIKEEIFSTMKQKDTLGGVFATVALNLPPGLGSFVHFDRKLDGQIAAALMSIPAMKAVEIGSAIKNSSLTGTNVHDQFALDQEKIKRTSNRAGGLEGGMTNGMPVIAYTYMKPISTTLKPLASVDLNKKVAGETTYERSDFCAVQRATVIGEAMLSYVLLNALVDKIGGDSKKEMQENFNRLPKGELNNFRMKDKEWRFEYDQEK